MNKNIFNNKRAFEDNQNEKEENMKDDKDIINNLQWDSFPQTRDNFYIIHDPLSQDEYIDIDQTFTQIRKQRALSNSKFMEDAKPVTYDYHSHDDNEKRMLQKVSFFLWEKGLEIFEQLNRRFGVVNKNSKSKPPRTLQDNTYLFVGRQSQMERQNTPLILYLHDESNDTQNFLTYKTETINNIELKRANRGCFLIFNPKQVKNFSFNIAHPRSIIIELSEKGYIFKDYEEKTLFETHDDFISKENIIWKKQQKYLKRDLGVENNKYLKCLKEKLDNNYLDNPFNLTPSNKPPQPKLSIYQLNLFKLQRMTKDVTFSYFLDKYFFILCKKERVPYDENSLRYDNFLNYHSFMFDKETPKITKNQFLEDYKIFYLSFFNTKYIDNNEFNENMKEYSLHISACKQIILNASDFFLRYSLIPIELLSPGIETLISKYSFENLSFEDINKYFNNFSIPISEDLLYSLESFHFLQKNISTIDKDSLKKEVPHYTLFFAIHEFLMYNDNLLDIYPHISASIVEHFLVSYLRYKQIFLNKQIRRNISEIVYQTLKETQSYHLSEMDRYQMLIYNLYNKMKEKSHYFSFLTDVEKFYSLRINIGLDMKKEWKNTLDFYPVNFGKLIIEFLNFHKLYLNKMDNKSYPNNIDKGIGRLFCRFLVNRGIHCFVTDTGNIHSNFLNSDHDREEIDTQRTPWCFLKQAIDNNMYFPAQPPLIHQSFKLDSFEEHKNFLEIIKIIFSKEYENEQERNIQLLPPFEIKEIEEDQKEITTIPSDNIIQFPNNHKNNTNPISEKHLFDRNTNHSASTGQQQGSYYDNIHVSDDDDYD